MEKESGLELDWFKEYFVYTTRTIDYAVSNVTSNNNKSVIHLKRVGEMPMPMDISIEMTDGTVMNYYIPLRIIRGEKGNDSFSGMLVPDWPWTHSHYVLSDLPQGSIKSVTIDNSGRLADVNLADNIWPQVEEESEGGK